MIPVASTDCVSMYTQNVSANHRKLVVTLATPVLISTSRNTGGKPPGGAPDASDASCGTASAPPSRTAPAPASSLTRKRLIRAADIRQGIFDGIPRALTTGTHRLVRVSSL